MMFSTIANAIWVASTRRRRFGFDFFFAGRHRVFFFRVSSL